MQHNFLECYNPYTDETIILHHCFDVGDTNEQVFALYFRYLTTANLQTFRSNYLLFINSSKSLSVS